MIVFKLPEAPETEAWRNSAVTRAFLKNCRKEQYKALKSLLGACKVTHDPEVRNAFRAYDTLQKLVKTLGGEDGEPGSGDSEE